MHVRVDEPGHQVGAVGGQPLAAVEAPMPAIRPSAIPTSPDSHSRVNTEKIRAPSMTRSGSSSPRATAISRVRARPV